MLEADSITACSRFDFHFPYMKLIAPFNIGKYYQSEWHLQMSENIPAEPDTDNAGAEEIVKHSEPSGLLREGFLIYRYIFLD
jgi:hypothetical protein